MEVGNNFKECAAFLAVEPLPAAVHRIAGNLFIAPALAALQVGHFYQELVYEQNGNARFEISPQSIAQA